MYSKKKLRNYLCYKKQKGIQQNLNEFASENSVFIFIVSCVSILLILGTDGNWISGIGTIIFLQFWSYFTHIASHRNIPILNGHLYHHNPETAHQPFYEVIEWLVNFFFFGGFILIPLSILIQKYTKIKLGLNLYIVLFWALVYTTYHMLNYHYIDFDTHFNHHQDASMTNFSPEWMDIMFHTKTEGECYENMDSSILNMVVFVIIILVWKDSKYDILKY